MPPENQFADAEKILTNLKNLPVHDFPDFIQNADTKIKSRVWNDKKISAHHAIIPTTVPVDFKKLDDIQQKLYILVAKKYLAQFFPTHKFLSTKILISFADEKFSATGKNILELGWKIIFKNSDDDNEQILPKISEIDYLKFVDAKILDKVTKPPTRFTPSTLLQAMKEIFKFIRDDSLKKTLKNCSGIGTEATRAGIIEKLQSQNFLKLDKKFLLPTEKALHAVKILPDEIIFPDLTAVWENQLENVANKKISLDSFYHSQLSALNNFVQQVKISAGNLPQDKNKTAVCPKCGGKLIQWKSKFGDNFYWHCNSCNLSLSNVDNEPFIKKCPDCDDGFIVKKNGKRGNFWACNNFPTCKKIFNESELSI